MRKLLLALALLFLLAGTAYADVTASVPSLDTECTVEQDGACTVTLHAVVKTDGAIQTFLIPISSAAADVNVTGAQYSLEKGDGWLGVILTLTPGSTDVTISYRLAETVTDTGSEQIFDVTLLYPAWECAVERYSLTVNLPAAFEGLPAFESGYYRDLIDNYMEITIDNGTIHAVLNSKQVLRDHEQLTMRLEVPQGYFDLRFLAGKTAKVDRLLFFMFLVLCVGYWALFMRNLPILPKRQAMPPEGGNPGEVPFVLTRRKPDLALMVIQWACLGYLTIHRTKKGRITLQRRIDMDNERKRPEVEVFRTIFSRGDLCDVRSAEYGRAKQLCVDKTRDYWQKRVFPPKAGSPLVLSLLALAAGTALCLCCWDLCMPPRSWRWFAILPLTALGGLSCLGLQRIGGFLLRRHSLRTAFLGGLSLVFLLITGSKGGCGKLMLLCVVLQLLAALVLRLGGRRTKTGTALAAELLGYRRYLLSTPSSSLRAHLQEDPQFFYRVLPYADALRVGRIFTSSYGKIRLEPCDWLEWEGKPMKHAAGFYGRYLRLMAGLRGEREPYRYRSRKPMRSAYRTGQGVGR